MIHTRDQQPLLERIPLNRTPSNDEFASAYCFVSHDKFNVVPVTANDIEESEDTLADTNGFLHEIIKDHADFTPDKLYLKNKNLLYSLNNPSISDAEGDNSVPSTTTTKDSPSPSSTPPSSSNSLLNDKEKVISPPSLFLPKLVINLEDNLKNDFKDVKELLLRIFPEWKDASGITTKQLTGGITNMLLSCKYGDSEPVLIRVYGHGTNLIIDRHREFISHLILNSIDLAPKVYARFKNGMIYGYLDGRSLQPEELSNPTLYPLIAQQLGNLHKKVDYKLIELGIEKLRTLKLGMRRRRSSSSSLSFKKKPSNKKKFISNIWELLDDWINIVPVNEDLISSFQQNLPNETVNEDNLKDIIKKEFAWLTETLTTSSSSPTVSSHCDLLSGNIIIPTDFPFTSIDTLPTIADNPIKFIDYEYMLPAPRAFDIANHLAEWQGFNCDRSAIPVPSYSNPTLVTWCKGYLNNFDAPAEVIEGLIDEIKTYYGLPGFYWGIWAMIQSEISSIDFNYLNYGKLRLEEYWNWKENFLSER
ncbi:Ethanolamine kinase 1 [Candida viswanathii]|uniref:ethanolamine kinase n=1 Tax=Candida viswanathii TaxID=5486 RepID=A0A367YJY3_9ASCO|nr:Ethanolamine kinase 1 [Candida viswanathii]